jgi:DNA-binding transcriptional MerR regulator
VGHKRPRPQGAPAAPGAPDTTGAPQKEYRAEELARAAGIPPRTLRYYRERGLLPPPRRQGRLAWYNDHHLARLRTITALLERGHTLTGIAELAEAVEHGRDIGELLGLGAPTEETPVRLTPQELADHFAGQVTAGNLAAALEAGWLGTDGDAFVHVSRRLLEVSEQLVREGMPLATVLAAGRRVRAHADALAGLFTELMAAHAPQDRDLDGSGDEGRDQDRVRRLRALAKSTVEAEFSLAMDRALGRQHHPRRHHGEDTGGPAGEDTAGPAGPAGEGGST